MMSFLFLLGWFVFVNRIVAYNLRGYACSDNVPNWAVSVHNQTELDTFMEETMSSEMSSINSIRCIQLSLAGDFSYRLNIVKMMQINLGTGDGTGLIVVGVNRRVKIECFANVTDLEELRKILKPISNISLLILDGLIFVRCPVPILIEEVSLIVVKNCEFM